MRSDKNHMDAEGNQNFLGTRKENLETMKGKIQKKKRVLEKIGTRFFVLDSMVCIWYLILGSSAYYSWKILVVLQNGKDFPIFPWLQSGSTRKFRNLGKHLDIAKYSGNSIVMAENDF